MGIEVTDLIGALCIVVDIVNSARERICDRVSEARRARWTGERGIQRTCTTTMEGLRRQRLISQWTVGTDGRTDTRRNQKKAKRGNRNVELPKIKCMRVSVQRGSLSEAESEEKSCVECVLE